MWLKKCFQMFFIRILPCVDSGLAAPLISVLPFDWCIFWYNRKSCSWHTLRMRKRDGKEPNGQCKSVEGLGSKVKVSKALDHYTALVLQGCRCYRISFFFSSYFISAGVCMALIWHYCLILIFCIRYEQPPPLCMPISLSADILGLTLRSINDS